MVNLITALICIYLGISLLVGLKQVTLGILRGLRGIFISSPPRTYTQEEQDLIDACLILMAKR